MTIKTLRRASNETVEIIPFGCNDARGREIGAKITRLEVEFYPVGDEAVSWYSHAPGNFFAFYPWATRNGVRYGASQNTCYFANPEEREAAISKYLESARKRAAKKAGA